MAGYGDVYTICGRKYLYALVDVGLAIKQLVSFEHILVLQEQYDKAAAFCCSFGLQMIVIETVWKEKCLTDFFSASTYNF
jgi:hypothetical protein